MASEKNLNAVFTDIANAIREKKGTTEQFQPINMAEEIANLPSGGNTVELSVTQNGIYTPNEGTAYSKVSVSVPQTAESGTLKALLDIRRNAYYLFKGYNIGDDASRCISFSDTQNVWDFSYMFASSSIGTFPSIDMSKATRANSMFYDCTNLSTVDIDLTGVSDASSMFYHCINLHNLKIKTSNKLKQMSSMFSQSGITYIDAFDTSSVTSFDSVFYQCYNLTGIGEFNTSNVTSFYRTFYECRSLLSIPVIDTRKVTSMFQTFYKCGKLESIPAFDFSSLTSMEYAFAECTSLKTIPVLNTPVLKSVSNAFSGCSALTTVALFDTSKVTSFSSMFEKCTSLTTIPQFNTSNGKSMSNMFKGCTSLKTIPLLDFSNCTELYYLFSGCTALESIPAINLSNCSYLSYCFDGCTSLKSTLMYGMKVSFNISASTQFEESDLVTILNNLATVTSTKTLTMGSTNLAKLTDEEKAIATNKGWTLK